MVVGTVLRVALRKLLLIWLRLLMVRLMLMARTVVRQMQTALFLLRRRILMIMMTVLFGRVVVFVRLVELSLASRCVLWLLRIV